MRPVAHSIPCNVAQLGRPPLDARRPATVPSALSRSVVMALLALFSACRTTNEPAKRPRPKELSPVQIFGLDPNTETLMCFYVERAPDGSKGFACMSSYVSFDLLKSVRLMESLEQFRTELHEAALQSEVRRLVLVPFQRGSTVVHGFETRALTKTEAGELLMASEKLVLAQ
ncbi:MAG: hypothetical protein JNJ88_05065 [Planctomycetes bacterium]|nr:hypothetical protein [Planctomycetota bacterium]